MESGFEGRVSLVTGAARGLGFAISRLLAERGSAVIMADVNAGILEEAASSLQNSGLTVHPLVVDLAQESSFQPINAIIDEKCGGRIDLLVNNAGGWRYARAAEIEMPDWDWTFQTNLNTAFLTTRAVMGKMIERKYGRVVNIASTDAHVAKPTLPHYAAAKAALVSLTRSLALELAPHEVLVNAVSPGAMATEVAKGQGWLAERAKIIPVGRVAEPEDVAEAVLFLGSPHNRFVVGQTLMVNGGTVMT